MIEKKLELLKQNLEKKNDLIDKMLKVSEKQITLLDDSLNELEEFDSSMDELDAYTQELDELNGEADELYQELSLKDSVFAEKHNEQIDQIKRLLSLIAEKAGVLQEKEQFTKQKLEMYFQEERNNIGAGRRTSKVALDYYKSMNRSNVVPPQFMDRKK